MSSKKRERKETKKGRAARRAVTYLKEMKERGERPGEEMTRAMTHRSLEGLGLPGHVAGRADGHEDQIASNHRRTGPKNR
ncbi:hypothetical protein AGMMS50256_26460 [Betaproteobacteria bacterium]|nr:hypothetical protein AGMMS50256_26460 [Betaproteobacteria bacterium]